MKQCECFDGAARLVQSGAECCCLKRKKKMEKGKEKSFFLFISFFSLRISTLVLLSLVANAQGGLFDTLFGVFNTVKNNNFMIQLGCAAASLASSALLCGSHLPQQ